MNEHDNIKADRLWNEVILPYLKSHSLPFGTSIGFFEENEPFRYGILGLISSDVNYRLCTEDILASIAVFASKEFMSQRAFLLNYITLAQAIVSEVERKSRSIVALPFLKSQRGITDSYDAVVVNRLITQYEYAFRRYFMLFDTDSGDELFIYYPSPEGYVDCNSGTKYSLCIKVPKNNETPDGLFLMVCDYRLRVGGQESWVLDVVSDNGRNIFATTRSSIIGHKGKPHIWRK